MAEEEKATEERRPFMAFSFNEDGEFDRYAGIYLHVPLKKPPTPEEIATLVGTIKSFTKVWHLLRGQLDLLPASPEPPQESPEPPPQPGGVLPDAKPPQNMRPAPKRAQRGTGPPSEKQCNAILAICHSLDADAVDTFFQQHPDLELYVHEDGHLLPTWASLQALGSFKASKIIEALQKIE